MEELSEMRAQFDPEYTATRRGQRFTKNSNCYLRNIGTRISNLNQFGEILKLDNPISYFHGSKVLSNKEKKSLLNRAARRKAARAGKLKNGRKKQYQHLKGFRAV